MNQTVVRLLRAFAVLIALALTILLGMQGYVEWQTTDRDPYANDASKTLSFISMLARIAIGVGQTFRSPTGCGCGGSLGRSQGSASSMGRASVANWSAAMWPRANNARAAPNAARSAL